MRVSEGQKSEIAVEEIVKSAVNAEQMRVSGGRVR